MRSRPSLLPLAALGATLGLVTIIGCGDLNEHGVFGHHGSGTSGGSGGSGGAGTGGEGASGTTTSGTGGMGTGGDPGTGGQGGTTGNCGDGVKNGTEACDGSDLGGATCLDVGYSSPGGLACQDCQLDSTGCQATCDGQLVEPGEACDGTDLGGASCQDMGYSNPNGATCSNCASVDYAGCGASCDGQLLEPGETCDGADLGGASCQDMGYSNPNGASCASCNAIDYGACAATCDGQLLEPGEPCDGANLGGHSCLDIGFGNAAGASCVGCTVSYAGCAPFCGNNLVEPGEQCDDGNMAPGDGCSDTCSLEGTTCANAIPIALAAGTTTLTGDTIGGGNHAETTCASAANDRVYVVTPAVAGYLTASLTRATTAYQSVLYVSTNCNDGSPVTSVLCADSVDPIAAQPLFGGEVLSFQVQANSTYFVHVDGAKAADVGAYTLVLDLSTGIGCNDPVPLPLEPGSPMRVLGSTVGLVPSSAGTCGGNPGGEVVYSLTRAGGGPLTVATDAALTNYNSVLHARTTCNSQNTEVACSNNGGNAVETINLTFQVGAAITLRMDGSTLNGGSSSGNYGLILTP